MKSILKSIKDLLLVLIDYFAFRSTTARSDFGKNVVLVRVDAIGDFVLWLPSFQLLARRYSDTSRTILVCNQACSELALATGLFSEVIGVDIVRLTQELRYRFRMLRRVSHLGALVAIQPTYSRCFLTGDSLIRASGGKARIGFDGDLSNIRPWQKRISDRWYTKLVPASTLPMMELDRNAEFLHHLGLADGHAQLPSLAKLTELRVGKKISNDYFVVFPGASSPTKRWPVESFAKIARKIVDDYGFVPVLCGGEIEQELAKRLHGLIGNVQGINYVGKTSVPELAEMIRGARLVVSNDTSAIHISTAVSTPSVCILGGGHYGRFMPYPVGLKGMKPITVINKMNCFGCNWQCQFTDDRTGPYPCVEGISIEQVMSAVNLAMKVKCVQ